MFRIDFVKYYDKIPFLEFLKNLTVNEQADIVASIDKLLELKNNKLKISEKLSKFVKDGVFELRVHH